MFQTIPLAGCGSGGCGGDDGGSGYIVCAALDSLALWKPCLPTTLIPAVGCHGYMQKISS